MDLVDGAASAAQGAMHGFRLGEVLGNDVMDLPDSLAEAPRRKSLQISPNRTASPTVVPMTTGERSFI